MRFESGEERCSTTTVSLLVQVLQYNVPSGKKNRGLALILSYKLLEDPSRQTPENIRLANIMGWCVEMVSTQQFNNYVYLLTVSTHKYALAGR